MTKPKKEDYQFPIVTPTNEVNITQKMKMTKPKKRTLPKNKDDLTQRINRKTNKRKIKY